MDNFEVAGNDLMGRMLAAMDAFAEIIMEESQEQCPVETGTLKRSARIYRGPGNGPAARGAGGRFVRETTVVIGYGFGDEINPKTRRPAAEYAEPVHEIIEAYHEPPTKAKFLEDPVIEHAPMMEEYLATRMQLGFETGTAPAVGAFVEGLAADAQGAGDLADLDAGDHPKGYPHE